MKEFLNHIRVAAAVTLMFLATTACLPPLPFTEESNSDKRNECMETTLAIGYVQQQECLRTATSTAQYTACSMILSGAVYQGLSNCPH